MSRRARGTGSIRKKGNIWWIRFPDGRGKRMEESSGSTRRSDAVKLLNRRLGEAQAGRYHGPVSDRLSFDDLQEMVTDDYHRKRSLGRAEDALHHLKRHFGLYRARNITADRLMRYVKDRRDEGAADATVKYELSILRRGFRLAVRAEKLDRYPAFPEIQLDNVREGFFEPNEFEAVRAELPEHHRGWATFAYLTGWRVKSEVLTRQWRHVDAKAGTVRLEPGEAKNRRGRTFPIDVLPELAAVVEAQRDYTDQWERLIGRIIPWVFHRKGRPIKDFYTAWRSAIKRAGYPGRIPHDFRRTAVRRLERAGVSRSVARQLVGHETDAIYDRYSIVSEPDLREGLEKVARLNEESSTKVLSMRKKG